MIDSITNEIFPTNLSRVGMIIFILQIFQRVDGRAGLQRQDSPYFQAQVLLVHTVSHTGTGSTDRVESWMLKGKCQ